MSVTPSKPLEAGAEKIGQKIIKTIPADGPARVEDESSIEVVDRPVGNTKLDLLKFMEEPVTVLVHRTADKTADPVVEVWNGGVRQMFIRGQKQTVKRKFIEILARARDMKYEQDVQIDRSTGDAINRMIPVIGLKYTFEVIEDMNPNGRSWLQNLLQES